jgi:tRNA-modifying protein YgfZ
MSMSQLFAIRLETLSVLRLRGADVRRFLQGQVSNDVERLESRPSLLAGLHDPQGRVIALLHLLALEQEDVLMLVPRDLAATVQGHLAKFVLRAKVRIERADTDWQVLGLCGPDAETAARMHKYVRLAGEPPRVLIVGSRHERLPEADLLEIEEWNSLDVADGLPEVTAATSGLFVSQMLNLDVLDAISFEKGCYTGQEIIARAHWRGRVKRRMQRFATEEQKALAPGERVRLADGRQMQIVRQARFGHVGSEFLAIGPLPGTVEETGAELPAEGSLSATQLALPYELPA